MYLFVFINDFGSEIYIHVYDSHLSHISHVPLTQPPFFPKTLHMFISFLFVLRPINFNKGCLYNHGIKTSGS